MAKRELKYVGHSVPRVDGVEKVTGKAKFVGDIAVPGMLYGKILRSPYPHARIRSIDATRSRSVARSRRGADRGGHRRSQSDLQRPTGDRHA